MNYLRSVLGSEDQTAGLHPQEAETVDRLVDRYETSSLLEDKRDAVRALKSLSKKCRIDVGSRAMPVLLDVMNDDSSHPEMIAYALDTLSNVILGDTDDDTNFTEEENNEIGESFAEIFIKDSKNAAKLIKLLEEYEFQVRWPVVKILTGLFRHQQKQMQEVVLANPDALPRMMDLLSDSREIVRNDALLLLIELSRCNSNIQKIIAFESAFERLMDIIYEEGDSTSAAGIIVEDCLYIMVNLLRNNSSNQELFRENSLVQRLVPLFQQPIPDTPNLDSVMGTQSGEIIWTAQKVANMHLMFQVVRTLVAPNNSTHHTAACQKIMYNCGLLRELCNILMSSGSPADILTEAINTVGEIIRGNSNNQDYFANVQAPSDPPRPAILVLLMSMVNEKQPFGLRCAVLYCFQCFVYKNSAGKDAVIKTLLPTSVETTAITTGHLLCSGLLNPDPVIVWFAGSALAHCLLDSPAQKEALLKVQLATSVGSPPCSLMQQCVNILMQTNKPQTKISILMLLCQWLCQNTPAVNTFLQNQSYIPFLTAQASSNEGGEIEELMQGLCAFLLGICYHFNDDSIQKFNRNSLKQIIEKRIGPESYYDKLGCVSKSEYYVRAAQKPHIKARNPNELIFDFEFGKLFKSLESDILRDLKFNDSSGAELNGTGGSSLSQSVEQHDSIVSNYKQLIKRQDNELTQMKNAVNRLEGEVDHWQSQVHALQAQLQDRQQLKCSQASIESASESNVSGQAKTNNSEIGGTAGLFAGSGGDVHNSLDNASLAGLETQLAEKCRLIGEREQTISDQSAKISDLEQKLAHVPVASSELTGLRQQVEYLSALVKQREQESQWYHHHAEQMRNWFAQQSNCDPSSALQQQITELEGQLNVGWKAYEGLGEQLAGAAETQTKLETEIQELKHSKTDLEFKLKNASDSMEGLRQQLESVGKSEENYKSKIAALEEQIQNLHHQSQQQSSQVHSLQQQLYQQQQQQQNNTAAVRKPSTGDSSTAAEEMAALRQEQEDLLVLLADQDQKLLEYRAQLRQFGVEVVEEDDDEGL